MESGGCQTGCRHSRLPAFRVLTCKDGFGLIHPLTDNITSKKLGMAQVGDWGMDLVIGSVVLVLVLGVALRDIIQSGY